MSKLDHILKLMPKSQRELAKQEIKDLMLGLIGEDEPKHQEGMWIGYSKEHASRNRIRSELRQKVQEL